MRSSRFTVISLGGGIQSSVWVGGHCGVWVGGHCGV